MEILIIAGQPEESLIDGKTRVKDLPAGLKRMIVESLRHMPETKRIIAFFDEGRLSAEKTIIDLPTKNVLLAKANGFRKEDKEKFVQTLELLNWHLSKKWRFYGKDSSALRKCVDCGQIARPQKDVCQNSTCLSIGKMRLVMGES